MTKIISMQEKHPIDNLFRQGLHDPDILFNEKDWEILAKKISSRHSRKFYLAGWVRYGIAASLILAALLLFMIPRSPVEKGDQLSDTQSPSVMPRDYPPQSLPEEYAIKMKRRTDSHLTISDTPSIVPPTQSVFAQMGRMGDVRQAASVLPTVDTDIPRRSLSIKTSPAIKPQTIMENAATIRIPTRKNSGWTLSVAAAPDLSGTNPLNGRLSGSIGMLVNYRINDRISFRAGMWYAKKLYQADFDLYRPSAGWSSYRSRPDLVNADCRILDIPINFNYVWKQRNKDAWFVSGGVSSYIMLSEVYDFIYPADAYAHTRRYEVRNENRHILGVANLGVGYQYKLSPSMGVTIQPFIKVPLRDIGHGNIRLYSTGVALSADIDLSRRTVKP